MKTIQYALCLYVALIACSSPPPTEAQVATEAAYGAALLKCVDEAKTLAESKACRAKVDEAWNVTSTFRRDAGL
jgi:hypothetical protein